MKTSNQGNSAICCSFCGIERGHNRVMIAGPRVYICGDCVQLCAQIVVEQCDSAGPLKEISGATSAFATLTTDLDSSRRRVSELEFALKTVTSAVARVIPAPHSIACTWCDTILDDREAAREHTATCAKHPAVIALGGGGERLRWERAKAVALLRMLDRPEARHPDVAEFLDGLTEGQP